MFCINRYQLVALGAGLGRLDAGWRAGGPGQSEVA